MADTDIRNRIITEFVQSGDKLAVSTLVRLETHTSGLTDKTARLVTVTQAWEQALRDVDRKSRFDAIVKDLTRAAASGKNLNKVLADTRQRLVDIGATENEVRSAVAAATSAGQGNRGAALAAFGREARLAIPAIGIPGTGIGSETAFRAAEILGKLGVSVKALAIGGGAAAIAIGAVALVLKTLSDRAEETAKRIQSQIDAAQDLNTLLQTGTTQGIKSQVEEADRAAADAKARLDAAKAASELTLDEVERNASDIELITTQTFAAFGVALNPASAAIVTTTNALNEAQEAYDAAQAHADNLRIALDNLGVIERSAAEAAQELAEAHQKDIDNTQRARVQLLRQFASSDDLSGLDDRIASLNAEKEVLARELEQGGQSKELHQELAQAYIDVQAELAILTGDLYKEVAARDAERQAIEQTAAKRADAVAAVQAFDADILDAAQKRAEKEASIYGKLNDNIISVTEKAAEASQKALDDLEAKRADLGRGLGRDLRDDQRKNAQDDLEAQIKFQRTEAKEFRDHLRTLRDIREDAQAQEFGLVRDRNFSGLRDLRVDTNRRLNQENRAFVEQGKEREQAYAQLIEDEARQRAFERESRIIRYQDALDDAQRNANDQLALIQKNKNKELQALNRAAVTELNLLNQKYQAEISMRNSALTTELNMIANANAARLKLEEQFIYARAQLYQQGGLGSIAGNLLGAAQNSYVNSNTLNAPINVTTGGNAAQTSALTTLIRGIVAAAFYQYAGAG